METKPFVHLGVMLFAGACTPQPGPIGQPTAPAVREVQALCRKHASRREHLSDAIRALNPLTGAKSLFQRHRNSFDPELQALLEAHGIAPPDLQVQLDATAAQALADSQPSLYISAPLSTYKATWTAIAWDAYLAAVVELVADLAAARP